MGGQRSVGMIKGVINVLKVSEWNKSVNKRIFPESLLGKYEVLRCWNVESVQKDWAKFKATVKCTNDVDGMIRVDWQRTKGSEW